MLLEAPYEYNATLASTRLRSSARLEKLGSLLIALESVEKLLMRIHKPAKKDKYGRYVAEVTYASGETMSLNEQLVA